MVSTAKSTLITDPHDANECDSTIHTLPCGRQRTMPDGVGEPSAWEDPDAARRRTCLNQFAAIRVPTRFRFSGPQTTSLVEASRLKKAGCSGRRG